jgi:hypothetical protein
MQNKSGQALRRIIAETVPVPIAFEDNENILFIPAFDPACPIILLAIAKRVNPNPLAELWI